MCRLQGTDHGIEQVTAAVGHESASPAVADHQPNGKPGCAGDEGGHDARTVAAAVGCVLARIVTLV